MNKKPLLIILLSFCITLKLFSQICPRNYEKGKIISVLESGIGKMCFKGDPVPDSVPGIYHTKYTIVGANAKEIYNIHFYFYKTEDSILMVYFNTVTGKTARKTITFGEHYSIRMFKNYKPNDTTINENTQYCTLFTVPDTSRPYIVLNQFQLIDDENTFLSLTPLNNDKLKQHHQEVEIYYKWKDSVELITEQQQKIIIERKKTISSLLKEMNEYKEKVIQGIYDDDNNFKLSGPTIEANSTMKVEFKRKLDPLFIKYFKNICPYSESNSDIGITFICKADGKIDASKTEIYSINSPKINWFEDSFKVNIAPNIADGIYESVITQRLNSNLINDFNLKYLEAFNQLKPDNAEFKLFVDVKKEIYNELQKYFLREMNTPTKYTYMINYKSTVEYADWVYEINRKGVEKIGPKIITTQSISENLINIFKSKIAKPKVGKYKVKICNVYINKELIGQDIQPA